MTSWGNAADTQYPQDMESPSGYHLRIYKDDAVDIALGAVNQLGTAIRSTGKLVVDGESDLNGNVDLDAKLNVENDSDTEATATVANYGSAQARKII